MAGITLAQAEAKLTLWMSANDAVARNQAFSVGGRSLTRANLGEIQNQIEFWDAKVKSLSASGNRRSRVRYITNLGN